jgi:hypothetical protein
METLAVPTTAAQAKAFVAPTSLSFPMQPEAMKESTVAGDNQPENSKQDIVKTEEGQDDSAPGIVPTLQYVHTLSI